MAIAAKLRSSFLPHANRMKPPIAMYTKERNFLFILDMPWKLAETLWFIH